jgi:hypothetical protein
MLRTFIVSVCAAYYTQSEVSEDPRTGSSAERNRQLQELNRSTELADCSSNELNRKNCVIIDRLIFDITVS